MLSFVTPLSPTQQTKLLALLAKNNDTTSTCVSAGTSDVNNEVASTITSNSANATNTTANTTTTSFITATTPASESTQPLWTLSTLMGRLGRTHVEANFTSRNTRHILITCLQNAMSNRRTSSSLSWNSWLFLSLSLLTCFFSYLTYKRITS